VKSARLHGVIELAPRNLPEDFFSAATGSRGAPARRAAVPRLRPRRESVRSVDVCLRAAKGLSTDNFYNLVESRSVICLKSRAIAE
jgi:hypothetical protein